MTVNSNLSERMIAFFGSLSYLVDADELVEVLWAPRGENSALRRECFPDLQQAARRAASLGPAHHVFLQAVTEPGTTPWAKEGTQLLAYWHNRPRRNGDPRSLSYADAAEVRSLYGEPSLVFIYCYPGGDSTCEAAWFYYRSRCPIREQHRAAGRSPELEW